MTPRVGQILAEQKRRGRPPLPPEKRRLRFSLRLEISMLEWLHAQAELQGITAARFAEAIIVREKEGR